MQTGFKRIIFQTSVATWIDATLFMIYRQLSKKVSTRKHRYASNMLEMSNIPNNF